MSNRFESQEASEAYSNTKSYADGMSKAQNIALGVIISIQTGVHTRILEAESALHRNIGLEPKSTITLATELYKLQVEEHLLNEIFTNLVQALPYTGRKS